MTSKTNVDDSTKLTLWHSTSSFPEFPSEAAAKTAQEALEEYILTNGDPDDDWEKAILRLAPISIHAFRYTSKWEWSHSESYTVEELVDIFADKIRQDRNQNESKPGTKNEELLGLLPVLKEQLEVLRETQKVLLESQKLLSAIEQQVAPAGFGYNEFVELRNVLIHLTDAMTRRP